MLASCTNLGNCHLHGVACVGSQEIFSGHGLLIDVGLKDCSL